MSILARAIEAVHKSYDKAHHIKAEHQTKHFELILKHLHECYQIIVSHTGKDSVPIKLAEDAYHYMRTALAELAKYKNKNEGIHLLLREVRAAEKHLKELVDHVLQTHRKITRRHHIKK